jgi:MFS family permease
MPKTLINSWPLFFGLGMIMIGNGLQGTLLGIRASSEGFGVITTGLIMSMYYGGFLVGSKWAPKLVGTVGHIRVFAALASLASATVLLQAVFVVPWVWILVRFLTGISYAGLYVVIESWLNGMATNQIRGKILSLYTGINYMGLIIGQLLLNLADPKGFELFILTSILISLALLPISLSSRPAPKLESPEHIPLKSLYKASPLGFAGVFLAGITTGSLLTMAPVYAQYAGMSIAKISIFMTIMISGALLAQYPIGWLSDKIDRRKVLILCTSLAASLGSACYFYQSAGASIFFPITFLFWAFGAPLYALSSAHLIDHLKPSQIVSASGSMILFNGAGACAGPFIISSVMGFAGNESFFITMSAIFAVITLFAVSRTFARKPVPLDDQADFVAMPSPTRSTPIVARIAEEVNVPEASNEK